MPAPSSPRAPPACTPSQAIVLVMLMLIAMCAGVALRVYGEAAASLPRVLYHRALAGGSLGGSGIGGGESCSLPLWRASSQLNISRWQYANVSRSVFPDGSPIRHFDSPNANVWPLAESQSWESETFKVIRSVLLSARRARLAAWAKSPGGDTPRPSALKMLDVGGWIGVTGLYGAQFVSEVHAFEPDPAARSELVANVALNPLFEPRIHVHPLCLSHADEDVLMKGDPGGSWSSVLFFDDKGTLAKWTVTCRRFAPTLRALGIAAEDIALIKMDVEGVEHSLLPAILPWLKKYDLPPVWVSLHVWLWQQRPTSDLAVLSVFREYARRGRVYDSTLKVVTLEELTDDYFASKAQPAYLLSPRAYPFPALTKSSWWDEQDGAPLPDLLELEQRLADEAKERKAAGGALRGASAGAEEDAEDAEAEDATDEDEAQAEEGEDGGSADASAEAGDAPPADAEGDEGGEASAGSDADEAGAGSDAAAAADAPDEADGEADGQTDGATDGEAAEDAESESEGTAGGA